MTAENKPSRAKIVVKAIWTKTLPVLKFLSGGSKTVAGMIGWTTAALGAAFVGYGGWKYFEQMKPVEILPANDITGVTRKIDHAAHTSEDNIQDVSDRFQKMRVDAENDSIFTAFARKVDTLTLSTIAKKAFAVDSIVDAEIVYAQDKKLYGKTYWATPVETILRGRADAKGSAMLKDALLAHLSVDATKKYIGVSDKEPNAYSENVTVLVDTAASGKPESLVTLESDGKGNLGTFDAGKYPYQIAVNKKGIRYINPADVTPAKAVPAASARKPETKPRPAR